MGKLSEEIRTVSHGQKILSASRERRQIEGGPGTKYHQMEGKKGKAGCRKDISGANCNCMPKGKAYLSCCCC